MRKIYKTSDNTDNLFCASHDTGKFNSLLTNKVDQYHIGIYTFVLHFLLTFSSADCANSITGQQLSVCVLTRVYQNGVATKQMQTNTLPVPSCAAS